MSLLLLKGGGGQREDVDEACAEVQGGVGAV